MRRAQHRQHVRCRRGMVVLGDHQQIVVRPPQQAGPPPVRLPCRPGPHAMHQPATQPRLQPQRHSGRAAARGQHQQRPRHARRQQHPLPRRRTFQAEQRAGAGQGRQMRHPVPAQRHPLVRRPRGARRCPAPAPRRRRADRPAPTPAPATDREAAAAARAGFPAPPCPRAHPRRAPRDGRGRAWIRGRAEARPGATTGAGAMPSRT